MLGGSVGDHGDMRPPRMSPLVLAVCCGVGLAACSGASGSTPAKPVGPNHVSVANFAYSPESLSVHVGDTVTWDFHQPDAPHNVVSGSGADQFNSGAPQGRGHFDHQFTQAGTYHYICTVHPNMKGTVTVTAP